MGNPARDLNNGSSSESDPGLRAEIERLSGQKLAACYQCGNCTAGCPVNPFYDLPAHRIIRLAQEGRAEVLSCSSIWLCAGCNTCTTRCPNNIDVARVLDVLRQLAARNGVVAEGRIRRFSQAFLDAVRRGGRIFEPEVLVRYSLATGRLLTDVDLVPPMLAAGKLSLVPHGMVGRAEVARIFARYLETRGE